MISVLRTKVQLPIDVTLRVPADANIIAVAYAEAGGLLNMPYQQPITVGDWQAINLTIDTQTTYHIEYYAPLTTVNAQRNYAYLWPGDYAVNALDVSVKVPVDTTEITTDPSMADVTPAGSGQKFLAWATSDLSAGEQVTIQLTYTRTSDRLGVSDQPLETGVVDENTQGRISLNNYLPYVLGGLGILLILAGGVYFWQTSKGKSAPRKRHRSQRGYF